MECRVLNKLLPLGILIPSQARDRSLHAAGRWMCALWSQYRLPVLRRRDPLPWPRPPLARMLCNSHFACLWTVPWWRVPFCEAGNPSVFCEKTTDSGQNAT